MGEYNVNISDLAKQDIRTIASYIERNLQEPTIAVKTVEAILEAIFTLEDMPMRIGLVNKDKFPLGKI